VKLSPAGFAVTLGLVGFCILALTTPGFISSDGARAILLSAAVVGTLAVGQAIVMISGNLFSLSLASSAAASGMAFMASLRLGIEVAAAVAIAAGVLLNAAQGAAVGLWRANPIIVTIAAAGLIEGAAISLSHGKVLYAPRAEHGQDFLTSVVGGIPVAVIIFLAVTICAQLYMRRTRTGREIYLLGDSREGARAGGLAEAALTVKAFSVAGALAGVAGILLATETQSAQVSLVGTNTYDAIAAALIGGNAVFGGRGSPVRAAIGAVAIAAITDLALVRGYSTGLQIAVKGTLVVLAVVIVRLADSSAKTA